MTPRFLALLISTVAVGCVSALKAGPYPHGFITGSHMHYISPKVSRVLYDPQPEPYVWPQPPISPNAP